MSSKFLCNFRLINMRLLSFLCACAILTLGGQFRTAKAAGDPVLLTFPTSPRAIAVDAVTMTGEPFSPTSSYFPDNRTRLLLFASNLELLATETASAVTATAQDRTNNTYPLNVEYSGQVPGYPTISYVIVRLSDSLGDVGDVLVSVSLHGATSNSAPIGIGHIGGPSAPAVSQWYVAPDGQPANPGTISSPLDLATALNGQKVGPGSTVWLRGGTYNGAFISNLLGTQSAPIIVRQYPGERAILDGNGFAGISQNATLSVYGGWATYQGFEVTDSGTDRSSPARKDGVDVMGPNTKFINLIVHDTGFGFGFWQAAVDAELYGNIIYNCGTQNTATDMRYGHAIYTQNDSGTKLIRDNIIFNQFGWGICVWPNPGGIKGYDIGGNVSFNNGVLSNPGTRYNNIMISGYAPYAAEQIRLANNYTYDSPTQAPAGSFTDAGLCLGSSDPLDQKDVAVTDNYFAGGAPVAVLSGWQSVTLTGNTFFGLSGMLALSQPGGGVAQPYTWDNNSYYGGGYNGDPQAMFGFNGSALDFTGWQQATGYDQHSQYQAGRPTGVKIFLRPNQYEPGRANIIIYNWDLQGSVDVDVSSVLAIGARYEVRNAQDYFSPPALSGTYDGTALHLPMTGLSVATPVGTGNAPAATGPEFNVFILRQL